MSNKSRYKLKKVKKHWVTVIVTVASVVIFGSPTPVLANTINQEIPTGQIDSVSEVGEAGSNVESTEEEHVVTQIEEGIEVSSSSSPAEDTLVKNQKAEEGSIQENNEQISNVTAPNSQSEVVTESPVPNPVSISEENKNVIAPVDNVSSVKKGWSTDTEGNTFYYNEQGQVALGYQTIDGELYYFNHKGIQAKGLRTHSSGTIRYYDPETGKAVKNSFITDETGNTFYFDKHGRAVRGQQVISGETYYFSESGILEQSIFPTISDEADKGKHLLTMLFLIDEQLSQRGLSLQQFAQLPAKSPEFYQKLDLLVSKLNGRTSAVSESDKEVAKKGYEEARKITDKWAYAVEMANLNMQRDSNARDINKEIVYMYLSHFVDIKSGVLETVNPDISNDGYFSAWIVNDDRRAYDQYLSQVLSVEKVATAAKFINSIFDVKGNIVDLVNINNIATTIWNSLYSGTLGAVSTRNTIGLLENFEAFKTAWVSSDDPVAVVEALEQSFQFEDYDEFVVDNVLGSLLNISAAATKLYGGIVPDMLASSAEFFLYTAKDLFDRAKWISLIQYNNMRVSQRMMRYFGLDWY